jgi:hypothetical protein
VPKLRVTYVSPLVGEDELSDAAKEAADAMQGADGSVSADDIRAALDLPCWVGIPIELIHAVRHELTNRPTASTKATAPATAAPISATPSAASTHLAIL